MKTCSRSAFNVRRLTFDKKPQILKQVVNLSCYMWNTGLGTPPVPPPTHKAKPESFIQKLVLFVTQPFTFSKLFHIFFCKNIGFDLDFCLSDCVSMSDCQSLYLIDCLSVSPCVSVSLCLLVCLSVQPRPQLHHLNLALTRPLPQHFFGKLLFHIHIP